MDNKYIEAVKALGQPFYRLLSCFPESLQASVREISIRAERPVVISTFDANYFLKKEGGFTKHTPISPYLASCSELKECIRVLTDYSLHSFKNEMNAGFITVHGGHRVGLCGSCVYDGGKIVAVNEISSINLRVARQIKGAAAFLCRMLFSEGLSSVLIAGPPACGKTTLLRDMARCLSGGVLTYSVKTSMIDERGELAAVYQGAPQNDVGALTDVFDGYCKEDGMLQAIRAMSPQVLLLDELSGEGDVSAVRRCMGAGASVIATIHAGSREELRTRAGVRKLLEAGGFSKVVILGGASAPGTVHEVLSADELFGEAESLCSSL